MPAAWTGATPGLDFPVPIIITPCVRCQYPRSRRCAVKCAPLFLLVEGVSRAREYDDREADQYREVESGIVRPDADDNAAQEINAVRDGIEAREHPQPMRRTRQRELGGAREIER